MRAQAGRADIAAAVRQRVAVKGIDHRAAFDIEGDMDAVAGVGRCIGADVLNSIRPVP